MEFNATFLVSAVSFIVFVFIMNAILYKPLEQIVEKRQNFINDANLAAKSNFENSKTLIEQKEKTLNDTKFEAKQGITKETQKAQMQKKEMQLNAQKESIQRIEQAKSELYRQKDELNNSLQSELEILADEISSKVLG